MKTVLMLAETYNSSYQQDTDHLDLISLRTEGSADRAHEFNFLYYPNGIGVILPTYSWTLQKCI
jgi:hypothetical protein